MARREAGRGRILLLDAVVIKTNGHRIMADSLLPLDGKKSSRLAPRDPYEISHEFPTVIGIEHSLPRNSLFPCIFKFSSLPLLVKFPLFLCVTLVKLRFYYSAAQEFMNNIKFYQIVKFYEDYLLLYSVG